MAFLDLVASTAPARVRYGGPDWTEYRPWPWEKIAFIDGSSERWLTRPVFRQVDERGNWKFRRFTQEELEQWNADQAL